VEKGIFSVTSWDKAINAYRALFGDAELLTKKEAARFLKKSVRSIERRHKQGKLDYVILDGSPRIHKSDILRLVGNAE